MNYAVKVTRLPHFTLYVGDIRYRADNPTYPLISYADKNSASIFQSRNQARKLANKLLTRGDIQYLRNTIRQATTIEI